MSESKNQREIEKKHDAARTESDVERVSGGASDYLLEIDGIKGETLESSPERPRAGWSRSV
jgi:hypothetical protein